jgi:hypothetical protein
MDSQDATAGYGGSGGERTTTTAAATTTVKEFRSGNAAGSVQYSYHPTPPQVPSASVYANEWEAHGGAHDATVTFYFRDTASGIIREVAKVTLPLDHWNQIRGEGTS